MSREARAQSETVGVVLLTAVFVLLASTVGLLLISNVLSEADDGPLVDIEANASGQYVSVQHAGGDSLPVGDVAVIVEGTTRERYDLASFVHRRGSEGTSFAPGDIWRGPNDVGGSRLDVSVIDTEANQILDTATVAVDVAVAASFDYAPANPVPGETVQFDASASDAPGSTIQRYEWDLDGDGSVDATGETVSRAYSTTGDYDVTLTVTEEGGQTDQRTRTVSVDSPTFAVTIDDATGDQVTEGDTVDVTATVENTGSATDTQDVVFTVTGDDGSVLATDSREDLTLDGGEETTVTFSYETSEGDAPSVEVEVASDGDADSRTVAVNEPGNLQVVSADPEGPVSEFQDLPVAVTVENQGDLATTQAVSLDVDRDRDGTFDLQAEQRSVSVPGGTSETVTLTYTTQDGDAPAVDVRATTEDDAEGITATANVTNWWGGIVITDTNVPVTEGETLAVDVSVNGLFGSWVTLEVDGTQVDSDTADDEVTLTWDTSDGDAGSHTITARLFGFFGTELDSDQTTVTVEEPMAERVEVVDGSGSGTNRGVVEFSLRNSGIGEASATSLRVASTTDAQASRVNNGGNPEFRGAGGSLDVDGHLTIGDPQSTALTQPASIAGGTVESFTLEQFRNSRGQTRNMRNEQVTLAVTFEDGSTGTYTVQL